MNFTSKLPRPHEFTFQIGPPILGSPPLCRVPWIYFSNWVMDLVCEFENEIVGASMRRDQFSCVMNQYYILGIHFLYKRDGKSYEMFHSFLILFIVTRPHNWKILKIKPSWIVKVNSPLAVHDMEDIFQCCIMSSYHHFGVRTPFRLLVHHNIVHVLVKLFWKPFYHFFWNYKLRMRPERDRLPRGPSRNDWLEDLLQNTQLNPQSAE